MLEDAAARSAVKVHRQMARGLFGLATLAATAPFVGMIGTVSGIVVLELPNHLASCGRS
jgi:biopolymer transport protein ExbB/TolQ